MALKTAKGRRRLAQLKRRANTGSIYTNKQKSSIYRKSLISNPQKKQAQHMTNRLWGSARQIVPDSYSTKLNLSLQGNFSAGITAAEMYTFPMNYLDVPFSSGSWADLNLVDNGSVTLSTIEPVGFSALCGANAPYQAYRVTGVKVKLVYQPGAIADTTQITLLAHTVDETPPTNSMQAMAQPHSFSRTVNSNNVLQDNIVEHYFKMWEIFGITRQKYMTENDFKAVYLSNPNHVFGVALAVYRTNLNGTATAANAAFQMYVTYYVNFEDPNTTGLLNA